MADVNRVFQIQMLSDCSEVVGVVVHIMALGNLRGAAVTTAIMRDDTIAVVEKEHHLGIPVVRGKRPSMAEDNRLTGTPVLVENLRSIFDSNHAHATLLCELLN